MPWKATKDPYYIWISEIILQQTRVNQGRDYYNKFIGLFPTINDLAQSHEDQVLKAWEGLGYYSRARNMHHAAKDIMSRFSGVFPKGYNDILSLKGIGPYTAAAISSFAFDRPYAVVDGNVMRILSRYLGQRVPTDSTIGKKSFEKWASELLDREEPAKYNQAIMDFGALLCTPKKPYCMDCPLKESCVAYHDNIVDVLPVKSKKVGVKERYLNYFLFQKEDQILIQQRSAEGIWAKLFEFPLMESKSLLETEEIKKKLNLEEKDSLILIKKTDHKLTHQLLHISFYEIYISLESKLFRKARLEKVKELHTFAFPKPLKILIDSPILSRN